jgi:cytochrome c-type biogenesis protein CcmH/NrfG
MTSVTRRRLEEAADQARRDLAELDEQQSTGEIDEETGRVLRARYLKDLEAAQRGLSKVIDEPVSARSRGRMLAGAAVIAIGIALAVGLVGNFIQTPDDATLTGVASNPDFDPANFSNETLEATLLSFEGDPDAITQTMPMRFRLAERYFEAQEFEKAFGHYRRIIESDPEPDLASAALTRVAWIVWVGNGLTDLALQTVDQALAAAPDNTEAAYVKAQIVWCGTDDPSGAVPLLESVLASDQIDDAVRAQVETDLELAAAGQGCG